MNTYDRYGEFRKDGDIEIIPYVEIPHLTSDYYEVYKKNITRLDKLSYQYYNNPNYGWLILMANPEVGGLEYKIPDNTVLRIPFPLGTSLRAYVESVEEYKKHNG